MESSSSSCTYSESYEGGFYVCLGEGHEAWDVCVQESERFGDESFDGVEPTFGAESEGEISVGEASAQEYSVEEEDEPLRESIFVHSAPTHFPDILRATKSAFGSIFVRTSVRRTPLAGRKTQPESQFSMIPRVLDSFDSRSGTKKNSVFRAFEKRGVVKEVSSSLSANQWDVLPIAKSVLFSFQIQDQVHYTRKLTRVEERIANASVQTLKFTRTWPSGSSWTGRWDGLGMAGTGTYIMPHDVDYIGKMQDGVWHDDDATLIYPNGFKALHCNYVLGTLADHQFQFPDNLDHEKDNWSYCQYPDRRFWSEIQFGLKPGKLAQRTQEDPPRKVPDNCYDTSDGFYNPKTKMLVSPDGELLRVPSCGEEKWIKENCRKGFRDYTGFRPDLYENWFGNDRDLINALLDMQRMHKAGLVTREELRQFYADSGVLKRTKWDFDGFDKIDDASKCNVRPYRLRKIYERGGSKPETEIKTRKEKPPKRGVTSRRGASSEKLSGRIKFSEGRTGATSTTIFTEYSPRKDRQTTDWKKSGYRTSSDASGESDTSAYRRKIAKGIVGDIVDDIVVAERERHRDRFVRTQTIGNLPFGARDDRERHVQVLEQLYRSIPDKEEFCDSVPERTSDLKNLAEDRFQSVRYWGNRIFTLSFDEKQ